MTTECVDCEGCVLHVGDLVVYNLSGMLSRGTITRITPARNYVARNHPSQQHLQFVVHIGDSIVRNTQGIYRLRDYDATLWLAIARYQFPAGERCGECHGVNEFADDCGWFMNKNSKGIEVALCEACWRKFGYTTGER